MKPKASLPGNQGKAVYAFMEKNYRHIFIGVIAIKLLLAYFFPITSDEAYFYTWVSRPDFTYYDHPPMTGWMVYLFSQLGRHIFFPRLFTILCGALVAMGMYGFVARLTGNTEKACLVSLFYLLSPLHMLFVLIATDTPLFLFVFACGLLLDLGLRRSKRFIVFLSGLCLGLAILSKYFAGLLLVAYLIYLLIRRDRRALMNGLVWLAGALPLILLHLYWNYNHCWTNVLFNVINRNRDVHLNIAGFFTFLGFQAYLSTPWLLWRFFQNRQKLGLAIRADGKLLFCFFAVPVAVMGLVAFHRSGLHWTLSFYPFLYLFLMQVDPTDLKKLIRYSAVFSLMHLVPIVVLLGLPVEILQGKPYYHDLVLSLHGREIEAALLEKYGQDNVPATNGYYTSGAMTYHSNRRYIVFHDDSKHGRQDDRLTDFRMLDGKDFMVFSTLPVTEDYSPYFDSISKETLLIRQQTFHVTLGKGFRYRVYREQFLSRIAGNWYNIPAFLPRGDCFYYDMYFPELNSK